MVLAVTASRVVVTVDRGEDFKRVDSLEEGVRVEEMGVEDFLGVEVVEEVGRLGRRPIVYQKSEQNCRSSLEIYSKLSVTDTSSIRPEGCRLHQRLGASSSRRQAKTRLSSLSFAL